MRENALRLFWSLITGLFGLFLVIRANGNMLLSEYDVDKGNFAYLFEMRCDAPIYPRIVAVIGVDGLAISTRFHESRGGRRLSQDEVRARCPLTKVGYPKLDAKVRVRGEHYRDRFEDRVLPPQNPFNSAFFHKVVIGWTLVPKEHLIFKAVGEGEFVLRSLVIINSQPVEHSLSVALERRYEMQFSIPQSHGQSSVILQNFYDFEPRVFASTLVRFKDAEMSGAKEVLSLLGAFFVGICLTGFGSVILRRNQGGQT